MLLTLPDFTSYGAYIAAAYGLTGGILLLTLLIVLLQWLQAKRLSA